MLFGILIVIALFSFFLASLVYNRQQRENKDPWTWSIVTFIVSYAVILAALFVILVYFVSWER